MVVNNKSSGKITFFTHFWHFKVDFNPLDRNLSALYIDFQKIHEISGYIG